jgi:hypothetical protein
MYFPLWYSAQYPSDRSPKEGLSMIFRHFLSPATGCASYVFG